MTNREEQAMSTEVPRGLYGEHRDGLGDPERLTPGQRARTTEEIVAEISGRRSSRSPMLRRLAAVSGRALGGR